MTKVDAGFFGQIIVLTSSVPAPEKMTFLLGAFSVCYLIPTALVWEKPFFCLLTLGTDPGSPILLHDEFLVLSIFAAQPSPYFL